MADFFLVALDFLNSELFFHYIGVEVHGNIRLSLPVQSLHFHLEIGEAIRDAFEMVQISC
jgi:hypothetical protein